jgi:hypothetical protein
LARRAGIDLQPVGLLADPRLDMDRRGLDVRGTVAQLKAAGIEVLCYVSHVREDLISEAREAGADKVMARGAFANQVASLVR